MPEVLRLLIENWTKENGCNCYRLQSGYLSKDDLLQGQLNFKNAVIFVHSLSVNGIITDTEKLQNKNLLTVSSNDVFVQYHNIVDIIDNGTLQQAKSDYVFRIDSNVHFLLQEGANAMFQKIYTASLQYVAIQPDCNCN